MKTSASEHPVIANLEQFDRRSGSLVERLLFNHRIVVVALFLILTAVLGYHALGIRLNPSFERMIPARHPYVQNYQQHKADLAGLGNTLRIAVESGNGPIFDARYMETLRKLNDELFLLPGVDRSFMKSIWMPAVRWNGVTEEGLDGGPVIPDGFDGSQKSLDELRANIERSGEIGSLVAPDFKSSVIVVPLLEAEGTKRLDYSELSSRLEQLRQKYEAEGVRIHITGFAKVVGDLIEGMQQVLLFFAVALAICTGVQFQRNVLGERVLNETGVDILAPYLRAALDAIAVPPHSAPLIAQAVVPPRGWASASRAGSRSVSPRWSTCTRGVLSGSTALPAAPAA